MKLDVEKLARLSKALSDTNRLKILEIISENEICAIKILERLKISQPTLSHHIKILADAGLIKTRKEGVMNFYSLEACALEMIKNQLNTLISL